MNGLMKKQVKINHKIKEFYLKNNSLILYFFEIQ